jgi:hypothetical protein
MNRAPTTGEMLWIIDALSSAEKTLLGDYGHPGSMGQIDPPLASTSVWANKQLILLHVYYVVRKHMLTHGWMTEDRPRSFRARGAWSTHFWQVVRNSVSAGIAWTTHPEGRPPKGMFPDLDILLSNEEE